MAQAFFTFVPVKTYGTMIDFRHFASLFDIAIHFDTPAKCREALAQSRWADGDVVCPYCGRHRCHIRKDGRYICSGCRNAFSVTVRTIFENTKVSLVKWFMAMYLISSHKKGVSSCQLARDIRVTQKTAWFMLHKLRTLYGQDDSASLDGIVECDEMYLGGREKNKHESKKVKGTQGGAKTKTPIFGMVERGGGAKAFAVPDTKAVTLKAYIEQFVSDNALILTDESGAYSWLESEGYGHQTVKHAEGEYSTGVISTNGIEGFWGHFKRMVFGIYHFVSKKYLQAYIDEAVYRWNTRKADECARFVDMFAKSIGLCPYKMVKEREAVA